MLEKNNSNKRTHMYIRHLNAFSKIKKKLKIALATAMDSLQYNFVGAVKIMIVY